MVKQFLNSVIPKYCDLSMPRRSVICLRIHSDEVPKLETSVFESFTVANLPCIVGIVCKEIGAASLGN